MMPLAITSRYTSNPSQPSQCERGSRSADAVRVFAVANRGHDPKAAAGLKIGAIHRNHFVARVAELLEVADMPDLSAATEPLIRVRESIRIERKAQDPDQPQGDLLKSDQVGHNLFMSHDLFISHTAPGLEHLERIADHPAILVAVAAAEADGAITGPQALAAARAAMRSGAYGEAERWLAAAAASDDWTLAEIARLEQAHWAIAAKLDLSLAKQAAADGAATGLPEPVRAEADWLTNRLIGALRVYREVPAERAADALDTCLGAAARLEAGGQMRRALLVRCHVAENGEGALRDEAMEAIAQRAAKAGFPGLAADAYRRTASANLREDRRAETDRFVALAEAVQTDERFGALELEALRQTIAVTRDAGLYAPLAACAERFEAELHHAGAMSCLLTLVTESLRRGDTVQGKIFQTRLAEVARIAQAEAVMIQSALIHAEMAMRHNRYSDALGSLDEMLARDPPTMLRAGALMQRSTVMSQLGRPAQAWSDASAGLALYDRLGAEADASDMIAKVALDLQADGTEVAFQRADALVSAWRAKDLARGDPLRAAGKLEARFDLRMNRLVVLQREGGEAAPMLTEMVGLSDQVRTELVTLPADARATKAAWANLRQREAALAGLRNDQQVLIDAYADAAACFLELGWGFQAANCFHIAGCVLYNLFNFGGTTASADHFGSAERCLRTALAYYRDQGGMRARAAATTEMLARLYLSAIRFFQGESLAALVAETERLVRGGLDDLDDIRRAYAVENRLDTHQGKGVHGVEADALYGHALRLTFLVAPDARKALHFVSRQKSRVLADLMAADLTVPPALRAALEQHPDIAPLLAEERSAIAALGAAKGEAVAELRQSLAELYGRMAAHTAARPYAEARRGEAPDADDLAAILDEPDAGPAFIDWVATAGQIWVMVARADGSVTSANTFVPVEAVRAFRGANLTRSGFRITLDKEPDKLAALAGVVAPLAELTAPGDHLVLCPTGPLGALPLHAVHVDGDVLLARNPVFFAPSLGVLRTCRLFATDPAARGLALFGVLDDSHTASAAMMARLATATGQEVQQAGSVTPEAVMHALSSVQAIHFQGHGEHDPAEPLRSCLRLPGGARLTAADIFGLRRVTARMVVLGACEGAVSRAGGGDELLGLIPAFLSAGVSLVVASGWRVMESTASAFMEVFYDAIRRKSRRPIEAVQTAALHLRSRQGTKTPYHWAAFVGHGDPWRRLEI